MRPTASASFLAVFLMTAAAVNSVSTAQARPARPPQAAPPAQLPSWVVVGDWQTTDDDAVKDALDKAKAKVTEYLRSQTPPMEWSPDPVWIQQKLVRDLRDGDELTKLEFEKNHDVQVAGHAVPVETQEFDKLGEMRRAALLVEVSQFAQKEIVEQEKTYQVNQRHERASLRQGVLVRVLAGLVALLAAVACYLRLEDATKGYYTTLLRLAAVAFVGLVGAGIWLLT
jgi:hypothetical protein